MQIIDVHFADICDRKVVIPTFVIKRGSLAQAASTLFLSSRLVDKIVIIIHMAILMELLQRSVAANALIRALLPIHKSKPFIDTH